MTDEMTDEQFDKLSTDVTAFCRYLENERKKERQAVIEKRRAKVATEMRTARQLASEADALTKNLRCYFND